MAVSPLQAHTLVADPHGDRSYADQMFVPREGDVISKSRTVDKDADESRTAVVLADDTSLSMPVTGTARYALEAFLIVAGDEAAGMSLTFTAPAGSAGGWAPMARQTSAGNTQRDALGFGTAATVEVTQAGVAFAPRGTLLTGGTEGSLTLQWAPAVTPSRALVLRAGSWVKLTRTG
jgi:hypothetical protein